MMELLRCRKLIAHPITHKTMLRAGLISILALLTSPLFAATAQMLTMDQALETAFANNPDLAAAQWETGIAQGERQQAGLIPNPEVSWEAEDTRRNSRTTTVMINQP
ncbi:TolC family protein, partial [Pseudomonas sp. ANT_H14]